MQDVIEKLAGVTQEQAFAFDQLNLYQQLGQEAFIKLSTNFYRRVYNDDQAWFRNIFKNRDQQEAIQNQYEFLIQRMGGPPLFSQRKGHPALIARHLDFNMSEKAARRWLMHMESALEETSEIEKNAKQLMLAFFKHTAFFLSVGVNSKR